MIFKRAFLAVLASLTLLIPLLAHAEWVTTEVQWQISSTGSQYNATSIFVRDTCCAVIDGVAGSRDTTAEFATRNAMPLLRGVVAPGISEQGAVTASAYSSPSDTTVLGFLLFQPDTTGPPTATLSSMTVLVDGRAAGTGSTVTLARGWVKADSALVNGAAGGGLIVGDETIVVPVRTISPYGNVMRFPILRARITAATGILSGAVRVYWRYWKG